VADRYASGVLSAPASGPGEGSAAFGDAAAAGQPLEVLIVGGGVAALEAALALADLAGELTRVTVLAPNAEFVYRPLAVREPFAYGRADRFALAPIVEDARATLIADRLSWVDPGERVAHTEGGRALPYGALLLAMGALARPRYEHAITIDASRLDEVMHGLIQDVEEGYVRRLAFVSPGRMSWPLPIYELAMMTAGRADEANEELAVTIITPEDSPLAIFGSAVSDALMELLSAVNINVITSAYAEIPSNGNIVVNPGDRRIAADRIVALPELYGPPIRGIPCGEHGFLRIDPHGEVAGTTRIYAAGDATDFAVKFGGIAAQQADAAAEAIAALAGAPVSPQPLAPVIHGMLLTNAKPLYLSARLSGGHGFSSEISDTPIEEDQAKIAAKYLTPYLHAHAR
jgi:sulfide:quinone oxidoreductase